MAPAFYSLKDTKTPVIVAFWVMIAYLLLSVILMRPLRVGGIALALSLASALNFGLLFYLLERKIGVLSKKPLLVSAGKALVSAAIMGGGVSCLILRVGFNTATPVGKVGLLALVVASGIMVYFLLQWLINRDEAREVVKLFQWRLSPGKEKEK